EACHIHRQNVLAWIVLGHPARKHESDPASLAEPRHHRAGYPVVANATHGSHQRIAIGSEREGTIDGFADADAPEGGEMAETNLEVGREPLEVLGQELHGEIVRGSERRPDDALRLISADESAAALLA